MDVEEILAKIRAFCEERTRESSVIRKAGEKIAGGKATYAEAQKVAMEEGRILEEAFTKYLPEALTNGYLYREFAEKLVKVPVRDQAKEVTKAAEDVQEALNEAAGIGIRPIVPELNREQLDGIVTGICNENFERGKSEFFSQVENFLEGHVDDFVRENADFQYKTGLSPKIERIANAKCCDWCSRMAGIYNYADVSDQGNDVFRRHKNCHCLVTYNPGNGSKRRQDVYTKRWTDRENPAIIEERTQLKLDLQQFAWKSGDYRATMYRENWQSASLKETVKRFANNAKGHKIDRGKTEYVSKDGKITVVYDRYGNYFRIRDNVAWENGENHSYIDLNGNKVNGKNYEQDTHFNNTDKGGSKR